jgi:hypothetical protein
MMSQKSKNHCVEIEQHPWVRSWAKKEKLNNQDFEVYNTRITFLIKVDTKNYWKTHTQKKKTISTLRNNILSLLLRGH